MLVDYKAYAQSKGIIYSPFSPHKITISTIEEIARHQGVIFRQGDVFILRTGLTEAIDDASEEDQLKMINSLDSCGVEDTLEAVRWFWDHDFSAVAADNIGFEVMRPTKDGTEASGTTADYGKQPHNPPSLESHSLLPFLAESKLICEYSSSSEFPVATWTAHRRALGFEGPLFLL